MKLLSARTHSIIGLVVGVALLLAPNIFGFNDVGGAAVTIPRVIGIIVILSELMVRGSVSGMGFVSMKLHIGIDVILGAFLALSPWLYGFNDTETMAWAPHLIVGIMMVGYAVVTRADEKVPAHAS